MISTSQGETEIPRSPSENLFLDGVWCGHDAGQAGWLDLGSRVDGRARPDIHLRPGARRWRRDAQSIAGRKGLVRRLSLGSPAGLETVERSSPGLVGRSRSPRNARPGGSLDVQRRVMCSFLSPPFNSGPRFLSVGPDRGVCPQRAGGRPVSEPRPRWRSCGRCAALRAHRGP